MVNSTEVKWVRLRAISSVEFGSMISIELSVHSAGRFTDPDSTLGKNSHGGNLPQAATVTMTGLGSDMYYKIATPTHIHEYSVCIQAYMCSYI